MPNILQKSTLQAGNTHRVRHTANCSRAPIPAPQRKQKAEEREARQAEIDALFNDWLDDTVAKANTYAEKFNKKPRYFLDLFFHGGARMVRKHKKKNAHSAFLSLKARELREEGENVPLLDIQTSYREEYATLGNEERQEILREHNDSISSFVNAPRVSPRARIQDFANTVQNMVNLINGLKLRAGVEGFFCLVRNTTAYHTQPKWFFTSKELENYMPLAAKNWSLNSVGTKLEAFAVAGCDPINMCTTSKKKADYYKMVIREKIQTLLVDITGNPNALMQYSRYEQDIVQRYGVVLEGWTYNKLRNPSLLSTSLPPLAELHDALVKGTCKFVKLTPAQKKEREAEHQAKIASGEVVVPARKKRKDAGKPRKTSRKRTKTSEKDKGKRRRRDGDDGDDESDDESEDSDTPFKSASVVGSDDE